MVCSLGADQERIKAKIRKELPWNPVELRVSADAYGISCCTVLNDLQQRNREIPGILLCRISDLRILRHSDADSPYHTER